MRTAETEDLLTPEPENQDPTRIATASGSSLTSTAEYKETSSLNNNDDAFIG